MIFISLSFQRKVILTPSAIFEKLNFLKLKIKAVGISSQKSFTLFVLPRNQPLYILDSHLFG